MRKKREEEGTKLFYPPWTERDTFRKGRGKKIGETQTHRERGREKDRDVKTDAENGK